MNLVFGTQRLQLKPVSEDELDILQHIFTDPYVRRYLCDDKILALQQVEEMLSESQKLFNKQNFGLWLIRTKDNEEVIGVTGLWYFFEEEQPQLVYALLPQATKKGYATEAATRILEYCFDELGYQYLIASCDRPNLESCNVAERLGMKEVEERIVSGNPLLFFRIESSRATS
ncbi:MAG: GNAT family N-acetyltransferase [Leptolyngbyaceae cyanobacterium SM1_4_3]|nr:GNAT family N-acetyltransferase [Leptolyngbyaceae cyanobacterium SM1_4_3]NJO67273.1 GNAT family N-acetyltransferase [Leptolyngbyaceae cyanobacterium RM1_405_57]